MSENTVVNYPFWECNFTNCSNCDIKAVCNQENKERLYELYKNLVMA